MNAQDTAAVIAYFGAAWPSFDPSDDTLDVWVTEVEDIDPADAGEAMRALVKHSDFAPSIAKFRAECLAVRLRNHQTSALPTWNGRQPWPKELADELRAILAKGGARDHYHGGPDPCPVCGGMGQPSKRRQKVPLAKERCSRCGQNTMQHCATLEPVEVVPASLHPEQTGVPFKTPEQINRTHGTTP